jgi:uncharacterized RDD family membrane protein YckC
MPPRSREYTVETPEKILLKFALADPGSRAAAWVIDFLVQGALYLCFTLAFLALSAGSRDGPADMGLGAGLSAAFYYILLFLLKWGYYVLFESLMKGRTPGKKALGIMVAMANGAPLDFESVVVRNLVRVVDDFPLAPLLGFLFAISTPLSQRLGDVAAGTIVVKLAEGPVKFPEEIGSRDAPPARPVLGPGAARLSESELYVIRRFLNERGRLPERMAAATAARLAAQAALKTGMPLGGADPAEYLASIHSAHGSRERERSGET